MKNHFLKIIFSLFIPTALFVSCKSSSDVTPTASSGGNGGGGNNGTPPSTEVMINGYVADWHPGSYYSTVDYTDLTIAYFAFIVCDASGNVITNGNDSKMTTMITAAHAVNTKAYLSFGGGGYYGSTTFYDMANNATSRTAFAHNVKAFCLSMGFDGFDVDWEGLQNANQGLAHEALMTTLKDTLHNAGLGLIATVQQGSNSASFFTQTAMNQADLVQIMSYDATGTWSGSPVGQHSSYSFASDGLDYWSSRGVVKSKMVLGVPFYGYRFASMPCPCPAITYASILSAYPTLSDATDYLDTGTYSQTYFNGFGTISDKVSLAYEEKAAGIMIWELSQDATGAGSLLTRTAAYLTASGLTVKKLTHSIP